MARLLDEAAWTGFTKKQKLELDDAPLVKALGRLQKAPAAKPDARLEALADVVEQVKKQVALLVKRKKELGDKPFNEAKDRLYQILNDAEAEDRELRQGQAKAAKAREEEEAESDEEADSPALLTSSMVPLVRQLTKGGGLQMSALIAVTSKRAAVLIMKRAISPARRKLLTDYLGETSGVKYFKADVAGESGQLQFLLDASPGGLSKKLRAALLDQTGLRLKVFVQFGDETETDGEEGGDGEGRGGDMPAGPSGNAPAPGTQPAPGTASGVPPAPPVPSAAQLAYVQRLRLLRPAAEAALKAQHPEATKIRALLGFASEKADEAGDFAGATKALDMVAKLLQGAGAPPTPGAPANPTAPSTAPTAPSGTAEADTFKQRLAALMPALKEAVAGGGPLAQSLKAGTAQAGLLARQRDFAAAGQLLRRLEGLVVKAAPVGAGGGAGRVSLVALGRARLEWAQARQHALGEFARLKRLLQDEYADDAEEAATLQNAQQRLDQAVNALSEELHQRLDQVLNGNAAQRPALVEGALPVLQRMQDLLAGDPLLDALDGNEFAPDMLAIAPLRGHLRDIRQALGA